MCPQSGFRDAQEHDDARRGDFKSATLRTDRTRRTVKLSGRLVSPLTGTRNLNQTFYGASKHPHRRSIGLCCRRSWLGHSNPSSLPVVAASVKSNVWQKNQRVDRRNRILWFGPIQSVTGGPYSKRPAADRQFCQARNTAALFRTQSDERPRRCSCDLTNCTRNKSRLADCSSPGVEQHVYYGCGHA